jgi:hypothetical protein
MSSRIYFLKIARIVRVRITALLAAALAFLLFVALFSCAASAHRPVIEDRDASGYDNATYIRDPEISWALYGFLDSPDDVDFYAFDVKGCQNLSTNILVPAIDVYRDFRPSCAIVGPGINGTVSVPFDLPPGMGARIIDMPADSGRFYEPFGGINYWQSPVNYTWLVTPGRYYVAVFDRKQSRGDYVLAIGEKESFGLFDLPEVLWTTLRIRRGVWDHSSIVAGKK